jgi:hypothetical protein
MLGLVERKNVGVSGAKETLGKMCSAFLNPPKNYFFFQPKEITLKSMKLLTARLDIDWLKSLNNHLLFSSKLTENDKIMITNPDKLQKLVRFIETVDKK